VNADVLLDVGDMPRLICNAVDEQNYHFVEVQQNAGNTTIRFYKREGGANSLLHEEDISQLEDESGLTICINNESFSFKPNPSPPGSILYYCNPTLFSTGRKAGVGNGGAQKVEFETFTLENFYGERVPGEPPVQCCTQQCMCEENGSLEDVRLI